MRLRTAFGNFGTNQQQGRVCPMRRSVGPNNSTSARDFSTGFIPNRDYRNLSLASRTSVDTSLGTTAVTLATNDRPFGAEQFYGDYNSWERTRTWFASARQSLGREHRCSVRFPAPYRPFCSLSRSSASLYQSARRRELSGVVTAARKPGPEHQAVLRSGSLP